METSDPSPDLVSPLSLDGVDALHGCKILIIDDEVPNVQLLERVLSRAGFENFISTSDSRQAATLFSDFQPDLVLTDWLMPEVDGCAVIEQMHALISTDDYRPIVVLTADMTRETRKRALTAGATDFLTKPFDQIEVILRIRNLLQTRLSHLVIQTQNAALEEHVRERTIDLERTLVELRSTQQQVIQQERLAALGTMAGGIAHDFNNALSVIIGFGELLLRDATDSGAKDEAKLPITSILTAADDAAKIVHRLRAFYHPGEPEEQRLPVDLNKLVEQAIALTKPRWQTEATACGHEITVTNSPGEIPLVTGDAAELREVLTNLIFNAVDALPEGGAITLGTCLEEGSVTLKITDTGTGMREEVQRRCFEPFFTTKGQRGTGFGLSMVFGIIRRHGGSIGIESELGKGTSFLLRLPPASEVDVSSEEEIRVSNGHLRVLVVEDQPILGQLVCEYLKDDLHTAETVPSGSEALERFHESDFDLVITDYVMAGMTGEQLAISMKELKPEVPVVLLTGYVGEAIPGKEYSKAIDLVLPKPLSRGALRRALTAVVTEN